MAERQWHIGRQRRAAQGLKLRAALAALEGDEQGCEEQLSAARRALAEVQAAHAEEAA